jgi:hypothetical protein
MPLVCELLTQREYLTKFDVCLHFFSIATFRRLVEAEGSGSHCFGGTWIRQGYSQRTLLAVVPPQSVVPITICGKRATRG